MSQYDEITATSSFVQDPYPAYDELRTTLPIAWSERSDAWVLLRHRDVRAAGRDPRLGQGDRTAAYVRNLSADAREELHPLCEHMPRFTSFLDPPEHTRQRRLAAGAFGPGVVENLAPEIARRATALVRAGLANGGMDVLDEFAQPLTCATIAELLGVPVDDQPTFVRWVEDIFAYLGSDHTDAELARRASSTYAEVTSYLTDQIVRRRRSPSNDLIGRLSSMEQTHGVTESETLPVLIGILQGGFETTTSLISNGTYAFLAHPGTWSALVTDRTPLPSAIEECLRFESSLKYVTRCASEPIEFGDVVVEVGQTVILALAAANRDPGVFSDPYAFDIRRDPNPHVAFGLATHFCLGAHLARLQARIAFDALLEQCPNLALARPADEYRWRDNGMLRQLEELSVWM